MALAVPLAVVSVGRVRSDVRSQAISQGTVVAAGANDLMVPPHLAELNELARTSGLTLKGRVVILDAQGTMVADSAGTGRTGADYSTRPEVRDALQGKAVQVQRYSNTLKRDLIATAVPIENFGKTVGVVRVTQGADALNQSIRRSVLLVMAVGLLVLLLGLGAGWFIANQLSRPLRRLEQVAVDVAEGDLEARAEIEGPREQQNLAVAFNDMTDQLVRMIESQQQFVADASHQLRTPLAALRLRVEEARDLGVPKEADEELASGLLELQRIRAMIDDLLMLSRIGERSGPGERIDLAEYIKDTANRWEQIADEAGIELKAEPVPPFGKRHGFCNRPDLDRVVDALVENSVRYSQPGSKITLAVVFGTIEINDGGPGLGEGEEDAVFERFRRGSAGQAVARGTGLGLSIARDLMRAWKGDVTLANREEGGARAVVSFSDGPQYGGLAAKSATKGATVD